MFENVIISRLRLVLLAIMSIYLTGCMEPPKPEKIYQAPKKDIVLQANGKAIAKNGALVLSNGNTIYDEEGNIVKAFTINDKVFYILNKENSDYVLKDINKKVIKDFKADMIGWYYTDNSIIIGVSKKYSKSRYYNFLYSFNGNEVKIIGKNIYSSGLHSGIYNIYPHYGDNLLLDYTIYNVLTKKQFKSPYEMKYIVGAIGDKIFYLENKGFSNNAFFKVYDPKIKKSVTLAQMDDHIEFLQAGDQIVLRIITDKSVKPVNDVASTFKNLPTNIKAVSRYISLNTLEEVKGVSSDFKPIIIHETDWSNSQVKSTYVTFTVDDLNSYYLNQSFAKNVKLLF